ncbi:hypothetical protein [Paraglaciecola sp. L3A3]|uniref:hypothetical protein n=1 Tax=Paraglaciecola sp. L3A3 TaxID=2686358 RepID=UPI00131B2758|nr:hypothetical protein [Paraglaciecola sp. L3A3]
MIIPTVVTSRRAKLLKDKLFDVTWMHTNKELELTSSPIRIPLFKGLLGLRLFFVRQAELSLFSNIESVEQLKVPMVGQGDNWTDTRILQLNNFNLVTAMNTDSLMQMLLHSRFDYFPRSVLEIWSEKALQLRCSCCRANSCALLSYCLVFFCG